MKKIVNKKAKDKTEKDIKVSDVLNVVLDLKDLMLTKFEDTRRELTAFTELRFSEVMGILKDERQINNERHEENKKQFSEIKKRLDVAEFKLDNIIDKIDTHETRLSNLEKIVFEEK